MFLLKRTTGNRYFTCQAIQCTTWWSLFLVLTRLRTILSNYFKSTLAFLCVTFRKLWAVILSLQALEIPHSICFLRSGEGIRAIIWPRNSEVDYQLKLLASQTDHVINVAVAEMAGQIFTGDKELFEKQFDSELLERSFKRVQLSNEKWNELLLSIEKYI